MNTLPRLVLALTLVVVPALVYATTAGLPPRGAALALQLPPDLAT